MGNAVRVRQGSAPVSLGSCMEKAAHDVLGTVPGCLRDGSVPAGGGFLLGSPCWPSWCSLFAEGWHCLPGPIGYVTGPAEGRAS